MTDVSFCEDGVGVGKENPENAFFFEKFYRGHDPPHHRRSLYTPPVEPLALSAPGRPAHHRQQGRPCQNQGGASTRADHAKHDTRPGAGHAAPVCTRYQTGHAGQIVPAAGAGRREPCPAKCTISDSIFILIYICIFCVKPLTAQI